MQEGLTNGAMVLFPCMAAVYAGLQNPSFRKVMVLVRLLWEVLLLGLRPNECFRRPGIAHAPFWFLMVPSFFSRPITNY